MSTAPSSTRRSTSGLSSAQTGRTPPAAGSSPALALLLVGIHHRCRVSASSRATLITPPYGRSMASTFAGSVWHRSERVHQVSKTLRTGFRRCLRYVLTLACIELGIQVIQEIGPIVKNLTIYQRTPNFCLPMNQRQLDPKEEEQKKANGDYEKAFNETRKTFSGFTYDFIEKNTFDDSPEDREKFYHKLLIEQGGFHYWLNTYKDMLFDQKANDEAYKFWRNSVLKRVKNKEKQELLAPEVPPHPWGTKRPSLEQRIYEVFDQDNVEIIDVNENPIIAVEANGLRTKKGLVEVDTLILATGFDSVTGSLAQLAIQSTNGGTIADHWKDRLQTSMGIAIPGYP